MNDSINRFFNEQIKKIGINVLVNGKENKALFKEIDNKNGYDEKYMFTELSAVKQGDIVTFNNTNYLVMSKDNNIGQTYDKTVICRLAHTIKVYIDDELIEIPILIQTSTQSVHNYSTISIAEGKILLTMQLNKYTRKIDYNKRILIMGSAWETEGFADATEDILNIYLKKTTFIDNDNKELEIPDYWKYNKKHDYKLIVIPIAIELKVGENIELKPTLTDLGKEVTNAVYKIENTTDIITTTDLKVDAIKEGQGIIKLIVLVDNIEVATCNLNVAITEAPPTKTYIIEGLDTIYRNYPRQFVVNDNKGIKATDKWAFTSDKSLVDIKVIDDATVELSVKGAGTIVLSATNGTDTITKSIVCKMRL